MEIENVEEVGTVHPESMESIDDLIKARVRSNVRRVSNMRIARLIRRSNASGSTLRVVAREIPKELVAISIDINPSNLSKLYRREHLSRSQTEELNELTQFWHDALHGLFNGKKDLMERWLNAPVPALEGSKPRDLMETFAGRKVLEGYIDQIRYGDYS